MNSREANTGRDVLPVDHRGSRAGVGAPASTPGGLGGWDALRAAVPGLGAALLLGATCPACWLAYAGLFTMLGLAWLLEATSLLLITPAVLGIALASLAYRAPARRGYRPLGLGVIAVSLIVVEKFWLPCPVLLRLGLALLVSASLWNAWPRQAPALSACAACTSQAAER